MHDLWVASHASYPHERPLLHPPLHPLGVQGCTPLAHFRGYAAVPDQGLIFLSSAPRSRCATSMSYAAWARSQ